MKNKIYLTSIILLFLLPLVFAQTQEECEEIGKDYYDMDCLNEKAEELCEHVKLRLFPVNKLSGKTFHSLDLQGDGCYEKGFAPERIGVCTYISNTGSTMTFPLSNIEENKVILEKCVPSGTIIPVVNNIIDKIIEFFRNLWNLIFR